MLKKMLSVILIVGMLLTIFVIPSSVVYAQDEAEKESISDPADNNLNARRISDTCDLEDDEPTRSGSDLSNNSSISTNEVMAGNSVDLTAVAVDGTAPYLYGFYYKAVDASTWIILQSYSSVSTASLTITTAGTYDVCIKVKDSTNTISKAYYVLTVYPELISSSSVSDTIITIGHSITMTGAGTGGKAPYKYAFYSKFENNSWDLLSGFTTASTYTFSPSLFGKYSICIKVKDALGTIEKQYFTVYYVSSELTNLSTIDTEQFYTDIGLELTGMATGGIAPYQYAFYSKMTDSNTWSYIHAFSDVGTVDFCPTVAGTYDICIKVRDATNTVAKNYYTVEAESRALENLSYTSGDYADLGSSVTLSAVGRGGVPSYVYGFYYKLKAEETWHVAQSYGQNDTIDLTPTIEGVYDICIKVKDTTNTISKKYFELTVEKPGFYVHYFNYHNWQNVKIYYYDSVGEAFPWTGVNMQADGDGWYTYKITDYESAQVIFNDGGTNQIPGVMEEGFTVSHDTWYKNGTLTDERPDEITVYFYKPDNWSAPNIYYYLNENDTGPAWPGTAMEEVEDNWYVYHITKYANARVMFNDGSSQLPAVNEPGFQASDVMWYRNGNWCNTTSDTDNDGLLDYIELILGTNINSAHSDNDGLPDGYEVNTLGTNPLYSDSDDNGTLDDQEDFDDDSLSNYNEYLHGTDPFKTDTDGDGLSDYTEVTVVYGTQHTDPLDEDTDGDTLSDGDDVALGFSPLLQDTDGNGILDCNESVQQELTAEIEEAQKPEITEVSVSFSGNGNIENTTTITNIYNVDVHSSRLVGLVGVPVEIETTSEFETAEIVFTYDPDELGDIDEDDLCVMWYDEDNDIFVLQESTVDTTNHTVSAIVNHFSKYMVVDKQQWFNAWRNSMDYMSPTRSIFATVIVIDCSGSMDTNDPIVNGTCSRILAAENYINAKTDSDQVAIITYGSNVSLDCHLTTDKTTAINILRSSVNSDAGGTNTLNALNAAINELNTIPHDNYYKTILFLTDGDVQDYSETLFNQILADADDAGIIINTVCIGSDYSTTTMEALAYETGGRFFTAITASEIPDYYYQLAFEQGIDKTDYDEDGLYDVFERQGMHLSNGEIVYTNPYAADSDNDGLLDGEEICVAVDGLRLLQYPGLPLEYGKQVVFLKIADPWNRDSDGDGLLDGEDTAPLLKGLAGGIVGRMHFISGDGHSFLASINEQI